MIEFFKKKLSCILLFCRYHYRKLFAVFCALSLILLSYHILKNMYIWDPGIDSLHKQAYWVPVGMRWEQICVNVESDESKFDINDDISLSCKFGIFDDELFFADRFTIDVISSTFDAYVSCPTTLYFGEGGEYNRSDFETNSYSSDAVFLTKNKLPFAFNVMLTMKDNVNLPAEGTIIIRIHAGNAEVLYDPLDFEGISRDVTLYYYSDGKNLYISDISVEDAIKRGKFIS